MPAPLGSPDRAAYLDHAATTPMRPEAVAAMLPFLTERFGNPSGAHAVSRDARAALDEARDTIADLLGVDAGGVIFTGSGTEADNLAVLGPGGVPVCPAFEHHAVLHAVQHAGGRVVATGPDGIVYLDALAAALSPEVAVVSVMLANNEIGTIQPLGAVAEVVRAAAPNALLHTDAVQAFPWVDVRDLASAADMISISAHKFGGPKGVGVLAVRPGVRLAPIIHGGGQERERRSGTHNVAGVVAMVAAAQVTAATRDDTVARVGALRDRLADGLLAAVPGTRETGRRSAKIAGNCHLRFEGVESETLVLLLDDAGVAASAGSACASGAIEPSHVLTAMGLDAREALSSLRLSLGPTTTAADVDLALDVVPWAVDRLRGSARPGAVGAAGPSVGA